MRKNAPRKWIHAILDLLPLLVIPIFAIYTRNESNTFENNIELQVAQNKLVDFNQIAFNGDFSNDLYWSTQNGVINFYNNEAVVSTFNSNENFGLRNSYIHIDIGHTYLVKFGVYLDEENPSSNLIRVRYPFISTEYTVSNNYTVISSLGVATVNNLYLQNTGSTYFTYHFTFIDVFDFTQMFGVGNEPTIQQFNQWYPNDYYDYTLSDKQLLKNYSVETLNNTDIGSQFLYSVYKPVNEYFNFNNLFNMQGIYDWLQLNLFGGNAPLPVLIVWNIIVYEFFIDLIFLLYSVFMFIIDFATHMIDSFTGRCR